jgi:hypothetical protein
MMDNDLKPGQTTESFSTAAEAPASNAYTGQPDDLHDLIGAPGVTDEEDPLAALRNDPNYSALIKELEYIAAQARLLFEPTQEAPSDDVWTKIQSKLHEEPEEEE